MRRGRKPGLFPQNDLLKLRTLTSDLEGHPTPRLPFVDMATGSLGQGLPVGIGIALNAKFVDRLDYRTYVLMGDGESVEGSVWEAAEIGRQYGLDNFCAIVDVNRLGQSDPTMLQHDMDAYRSRWAGFGWHAIVVDGHDFTAILKAFDEAARTKGRPTVLLARTYKGKGISFIENKADWHGKPLKKGEETQKALDELTKQLSPNGAVIQIPKPSAPGTAPAAIGPMPATPYKIGDSVATREAFGVALEALGSVNPSIVALDADVKNSTYTDKFGKKFSNRFFESFIAEQNMVGAAAGLAACGKIPFAATFACFFSRAYDFIRMAAISGSNIKLVGTHVGVSIGEDGPSQMGLEDIAMMAAQPNVTVLYPSDGNSTYQLSRQPRTIREWSIYAQEDQRLRSSMVRTNGSASAAARSSGRALGCAHHRGRRRDAVRSLESPSISSKQLGSPSVSLISIVSLPSIEPPWWRVAGRRNIASSPWKITTPMEALAMRFSARLQRKASKSINSPFVKSRTAGSQTSSWITMGSAFGPLSSQRSGSSHEE